MSGAGAVQWQVPVLRSMDSLVTAQSVALLQMALTRDGYVLNAKGCFCEGLIAGSISCCISYVCESCAAPRAPEVGPLRGGKQ